jgi:hypothetical protein
MRSFIDKEGKIGWIFEEETIRPGQKPVQVQPVKPAPRVLQIKDTANMSKKDLDEYAEKEFNILLDRRKTKGQMEEEFREKLEAKKLLFGVDIIKW